MFLFDFVSLCTGKFGAFLGCWSFGFLGLEDFGAGWNAEEWLL